MSDMFGLGDWTRVFMWQCLWLIDFGPKILLNEKFSESSLQCNQAYI